MDTSPPTARAISGRKAEGCTVSDALEAQPASQAADQPASQHGMRSPASSAALTLRGAQGGQRAVEGERAPDRHRAAADRQGGRRLHRAVQGELGIIGHKSGAPGRAKGDQRARGAAGAVEDAGGAQLPGGEALVAVSSAPPGSGRGRGGSSRRRAHRIWLASTCVLVVQPHPAAPRLHPVVLGNQVPVRVVWAAQHPQRRLLVRLAHRRQRGGALAKHPGAGGWAGGQAEGRSDAARPASFLAAEQGGCCRPAPTSRPRVEHLNSAVGCVPPGIGHQCRSLGLAGVEHGQAPGLVGAHHLQRLALHAAGGGAAASRGGSAGRPWETTGCKSTYTQQGAAGHAGGVPAHRKLVAPDGGWRHADCVGRGPQAGAGWPGQCERAVRRPSPRRKHAGRPPAGAPTAARAPWLSCIEIT